MRIQVRNKMFEKYKTMKEKQTISRLPSYTSKWLGDLKRSLSAPHEIQGFCGVAGTVYPHGSPKTPRIQPKKTVQNF